MFVQCRDGKFYKDPLWVIGEDKVISGTEFSYKIKRTKKPTWDHVRRGLTDFEIRYDGSMELKSMIFAGSLKEAIVFQIKFLDPPPVPNQHQGVLDDVSGVDDDIIKFEES